MTRRLLARLACYTTLAFPVLACGGSGPACLGWVEDDRGTRHAPQAGTRDRGEAQRFACNVYCAEADPGYDARYRIWLSSPRGDPSVEKGQAMYEDPDLMAYVTETCATACLEDVRAGRRAGGVDCGE